MSRDVTLEIETGRIAGVTAPDCVRAFKGIPYAAAPVDALRWRPPQPAKRWSGTRPCQAFGPRCVQPERPKHSIGYFGPEPESEDCLFLNVWTAAADRDERRPVMVYFHGGAYYLGSGALSLFDGTNLARRGVVLVTINYRLGRLGFLAHPALSKEAATGTSGNYGLLDQIAALQWVSRNIAAFGGDPQRITIFGQSVGATSCACLMASPLARGLFQRVIGQSGGAFGPIEDSSVTGDSLQSLPDAEASGLALARGLGANSSDELRSLPAERLQLAGHGPGDPSRVGRGSFDTSWVIVDGHVLPDAPYAVFERGGQSDVPLLVGTTSNEGSAGPPAPSLAAFQDQARRDFGAKAGHYLSLFPASTDTEAAAASRRAFSFRNFVWQGWTWAQLHARTARAPVFYYRFQHAPPIPANAQFAEAGGQCLGAFHGAELPYVFGTLAVRPWEWTRVDHAIAETLSGYWTSFAANANPNRAGFPEWPALDPDRPLAMMLDGSPRLAMPADMAELAFWGDYYAGRRAARGARALTA
jgi:para-nitrobenzyl esterase